MFTARGRLGYPEGSATGSYWVPLYWSTLLRSHLSTTTTEGLVPPEWKKANIAPLFKKGSRNKSDNYIPMSKHQLYANYYNR